METGKAQVSSPPRILEYSRMSQDRLALGTGLQWLVHMCGLYSLPLPAGASLQRRGQSGTPRGARTRPRCTQQLQQENTHRASIGEQLCPAAPRNTGQASKTPRMFSQTSVSTALNMNYLPQPSIRTSTLP